MYDIGDLLEGDMDGEMEGDDMLGDSLVGDSLVGDSLVGDSLVGDDMLGDDSSGSVLSRIFRRKRKAIIARKLANNASVLRTLRPTTKRNWPVPFGPTSVAAATTLNIPVQPQVVFRGRRLVVPSPIAPNFNISIVVGIATQQVQFGFLPAIMYVENAVGMNMGLNTAQIGQTITLASQNTDAANAHTFQAVLLGVAIIQTPC
jgi:hypothetical protein